mgnify:CR=1 FL=1
MKNKPQYRQEWILEELKKAPLLSYGDCWSKYKVIWSKSESTFATDWKKAKAEIETYQIKVQKEKERVSIEIEKEAVKNGLKTKIERVFVLQNQVDKIIREIENGYCTDKIVIYDIPTDIKRPLRPMEISAMRRNLKELQAEISKIEGDYATAKQEVEIKESKIDYSKIDTETLKALISARK